MDQSRPGPHLIATIIKTTSKVTAGIIIVTMIWTIVGILASFWWSSSALIPLSASIGGLVVLLGLAIEDEAAKEEKKEYAIVAEEKATKLKARVGWWVLMAGIAIEIMTGAGLAAHDVWSARQTASEIAQNNPTNRLISEISATISFRVKEAKPSETPQWGMPAVAGVMLCESNWIAANTNLSGFWAGTALHLLVADKFDRYWDGNILTYVLNFKADGISVILVTNNNHTVAWALKNIRYLNIMPKFLPHDADILGGSAVLTINSGPQKWFYIPAQKDIEPNDGNYGQSYQIIATESPYERVHGGMIKANTNSN